MRTAFAVLCVFVSAAGIARGDVQVSVSPGAVLSEYQERLRVEPSLKTNIVVGYRYARLENEAFWQGQKNCAASGCNVFGDSLSLSIFPYKNLFVRGGAEYRRRRSDIIAYDQEALSVHGGAGLEFPRSGPIDFDGWKSNPPVIRRLAVTAGKNTWSRNVYADVKLIQVEYREDHQLGKKGASPWYLRCDIALTARAYTPNFGLQQKDVSTKIWIGLAYRK